VAVRRLLTAVLAGLPVLAGCSALMEQVDTPEMLGARRHPRNGEEIKDSPLPRIMPETHLAAGQVLERQGDLEGALAQYEKAIAANSRYAAAYNRLAIVYQRLNRPEDAEHIFRQGIRAAPEAAILRNNLGYCYLMRRRFAEARKEFSEALRISPKFERARMNLAITLAQMGRHDESLAEFSQVVPADVAHYNLAVVCVSREDYAGAEKALRAALAINSRCRGAKEQLDRVTALVQAGGERESVSETAEAIPLAGGPEPDNRDLP
jgi:Flp pilus assembly protein TadD